MQIEDMRKVVAGCTFPDYDFLVEVDGRGAIYLQGSYTEPDVVTKLPDLQQTRRWFQYRDRAVFGPHFDVDSLWEICGQTDMRVEDALGA